MTSPVRRAAVRVIPAALRPIMRNIIGRTRYELASANTWLRGLFALPAMRTALADFEPRTGAKGPAVSRMAREATRIRGLAAALSRGDAAGRTAFLDALLAVSHFANATFRPATLQSYVDVSVRVAALRGVAGYVAQKDASTVTAALVEHAPDDRAVLLAHAEVLLDRARKEEATPLLRRALRMQSVCQTAQRLLARATDEEHDLTDRFCGLPFTHMSTSFKGEAFTCLCPAWVPYPVGNVIEAASAEAVWNSEAAREIRRSIHDGDFRYCSRTVCSYIAAGVLPKKSEITDPVLRRYIEERTVLVPESPALVQMNHDSTCNLACPSCRTEIITAGPEEQRTYMDAADRVLLPLLGNKTAFTYISGGGEAFASTHYRKILGALNRRDFPDLSIMLITNAQLLNAKRWAEFPSLPEMIAVLSVSIDAACAETYERLRRPGKWNVLMENLELISRMRAAGTIRSFQINFVVQAENFRELPDFIALGDRLGVDSFWIQRVTNYGSFSEPAYAKADVTSPHHPDHEELLAILRQPFMSDRRIDRYMLMPIMPESVASIVPNPWLRVVPTRESIGLTMPGIA